MKIIEKISKKQDIYNYPAATIAFLGDSVTHGCFECYEKSKNVIETIFEIKNGYSTKVKEFLNILYPSSHINIINAGLSGDNASNALKRLQRDILRFNPDLCVVSFQLNDSMQKEAGIDAYKESLGKIFDELKKNDVEIIFLTENYMATETSPFLENEFLKQLSLKCMDVQNSGIAKKYKEAALDVCKENNVKVCDMYSIWETMKNNGVNTTELLSNKLNHPIREFHNVIAYELIKMMFEK